MKTILSGTSSSIRTKLWWNSHWMVLFQNCVRQDGHHSAVTLLLKAALIQVSDYRLLGASGYTIAPYICLKGSSLRNSLRRTIKIRWKINSCTNDRNTLASLVLKQEGLQYWPLWRAKNHCVQNSERSINYNLSYCVETILSTGKQQSHNIIQLQTCLRNNTTISHTCDFLLCKSTVAIDLEKVNI